MKRNSAGCYTQIIDGLEYYAVKRDYGWTVGVNLPVGGSSHIDDFRTYRQARAFIMRQAERQAEKVGA